MADTPSGEKVGGIYVSADVDVSRIPEQIQELEKAVLNFQRRTIDINVNFNKLIPAQKRHLPLTAGLSDREVAKVQTSINKGRYHATVTSVVLSKGATASLRNDIVAAMKDFVLEIGVKANIVGQTNTPTIGVNVSQAGTAPPNAGTPTTRAQTARTTAPATAGRTGAAGAAKPTTGGAAPTSDADAKELADLKKQREVLAGNLGKLEKQLQDAIDEQAAARKTSNARYRVTPALANVAAEITRRTSAIGRPQYNPEWARTIMGLDTGKPLKPGAFLSTDVGKGIFSGIEATKAETREAQQRADELSDPNREQLFRMAQGRRGQRGKVKGARRKYGEVDRAITDTRSVQEIQAAQIAQYMAAPGGNLPVEEAWAQQMNPELAEGWVTAKQQGKAVAAKYIRDARNALKARVGGQAGFNKLSRSTRGRTDKDRGGEFSQDELDFMFIQSLGGPKSGEFQALFGSETGAPTQNKRAMGSVAKAGFVTQAVAESQQRAEYGLFGRATRHRTRTPAGVRELRAPEDLAPTPGVLYAFPPEVDASGNPIPGTGPLIQGGRFTPGSGDEGGRALGAGQAAVSGGFVGRGMVPPTATNTTTFQGGNVSIKGGRRVGKGARKYDERRLIAQALASLGITSNEPVQIPEEILAGSDYAQKRYALYGTKGTQGLPVRRALRDARNAEEPYAVDALAAARAERGPKARPKMEQIEAYRARAVAEGNLTEDQATLLNLYQGLAISRKAVKAFRSGLKRAEPLPGDIPQIPVAVTSERVTAEERKAAETVEHVDDSGRRGAMGGGGKGGGKGGPIDVIVKNFSELSRILTGQTGVGSMPKMYKSLKFTGIASATPPLEGTPEELAKQVAGGDMEKFRRILKGEEEPEATGIGGKKIRYGRGRVVVSPAQVAAERAAVTTTETTTLSGQRAYSAEPGPAFQARGLGSRKTTGDLVLEREQTAAAKQAGRLQKDWASLASFVEKDMARGTGTKSEASLATYFRQQGAQYETVRPTREARVRADPVQAALEKAQASSTRAEFPERAPQIAFGQLVARGIGFKTRFQQAQEELNIRRVQVVQSQADLRTQQDQADKAKSNIATFRDITAERRVAGKLTTEDKTKAKELGQLYAEQAKQVKVTTASVQKQTAELDKSREAVEKSSGVFEKVANIGSLFVGAKAFQLGLTAMGTGLGLVEKAGAKVVDQLMGFGATSTQVTNQLGAQTKALHGNTEAMFGAVAVSADLSNSAADYIKNTTKATAVAKAAGAAQQETSDLFRASIGQGGKTQGLYGGYGGLFNTAFLGSEMGGGKGATEIALGDVRAFRGMENTPFPAPPVGGLKGGLTPNLVSATDLIPQARAQVDVIKARNRAATAEVKYIGDMNAAYVRGTKYLAQFNDGLNLAYTTNKTDLAAFDQAANQLTGDAQKNAKSWEDAGYVIKDAAGNIVTSGDQIQKYFETWAQGKTTATPEQVYQQTEWQMRAQLQAARAQYRFQTDFKIPGQWGLGLATNPLQQLAGPGTALSQMLRGTTAGAGRGLAGVQAGRTEIQNQATGYLQTMVAQAQQNMAAGGFAQTDIDALKTNMTDVLQLGKEIAATTQKISFISAAQQADEFANSIRLAKRALQDAQGMAGKIGQGLGALQREQFMLGRQSQAIGLALSQRQINFQVAVAGFQAPGLTSEERQARMEQAKVEASYAQKQLDIQKQQFQIAGKEFAIQTSRALVDAMKSLGLLQRGRDRSAQIAIQQAKLENLQARQNLAVAKLNAGLTAADNIFETKLTAAANAAGQLGVSLDEARTALDKWMVEAGLTTKTGGGGTGGVSYPLKGDTTGAVNPKALTTAVTAANKMQAVANKAVTTAISNTQKVENNIATFTVGLISQYIKVMRAIYNQAAQSWNQSISNPGARGRTSDKGKSAAGSAGRTKGETTITMGEAGGEEYAILANPRRVSASAFGGGGTAIVININNPSVRNDDDLQKIAREVEKVINRKASLIGMRSIM